MFVLDTNVVSELRKVRHGKADANVAAWAENADADSLFVSAISILELELGVLSVERRDAAETVETTTTTTDPNATTTTSTTDPNATTTTSTTTTSTTVAAPTAVNTGSPIDDNGTSIALIAVVGGLVVAGGAFLARRRA